LYQSYPAEPPNNADFDTKSALLLFAHKVLKTLGFQLYAVYLSSFRYVYFWLFARFQR